jgi:transcription initiation factor TFIIIB Brf1 subunit/transcription initiation factor TFIIB
MWKVSKIKGKNINKCIKIIKKALPETKSYVSKPINFLMHISKQCLSQSSTKLAISILNKITTHPRINCQHPTTLAACAAFYALMAEKPGYAH